MWVPKEGSTGDELKYENLARDVGVELGGWSFGAQFADLNNDGTLDLYLTNGNVSLIVGVGATILAGEWDLLIYADMARWEIQKRQRSEQHKLLHY